MSNRLEAADLTDENIFCVIRSCSKEPDDSQNQHFMIDFTSPGGLQEPAGRGPGGSTTSDPTPTAGT